LLYESNIKLFIISVNFSHNDKLSCSTERMMSDQNILHFSFQVYSTSRKKSDLGSAKLETVEQCIRTVCYKWYLINIVLQFDSLKRKFHFTHTQKSFCELLRFPQKCVAVEFRFWLCFFFQFRHLGKNTSSVRFRSYMIYFHILNSLGNMSKML
jgi:hypothetical protein